MAPKRRSQTTQEMAVDPSQNDKSYSKPKYNIAIVGTISSGKSTLLNAIFLEKHIVK